MYKGINLDIVNVKTLEGREGLIISCEIKYNGKKIASYLDEGYGGEGQAHPLGSTSNSKGEYEKSEAFKANEAALAELKSKLESLPNLEGYSFPPNLDIAIGDLVNEREMVRNAKKGLVISKENSPYNYELLQWKAGSITSMLKKYGKHQVIPMIEKTIEKYQKEGFHVLMQDYYISIGVNPSIFD